ncbi:unnamed protein product [Paramecium octaurelia]|uniref:Uncharacterized protein n=1 Tax=Paramecium octaurelia TaxID=43137 RepID=A0A8S1V0U7_PAROT|nr:unnamed protein product [Paramecium octaurelia]
MNKSCFRNSASPRKPNVSFSIEVQESRNQNKLRTRSSISSERDLQNLARNKWRYLIIQQQRDLRYNQMRITEKQQCCSVF